MQDNYQILPKDIVEEILTRLDVKPLVRFRCVSKSWGDLIRSPLFTANREKKRNSNSHKLMCATVDQTYSMDCKEPDHNIVEVDDPKFKRLVIHGSCNGILLVETTRFTLYLWNPSTRESKLVQNPYAIRRGRAYGFAYNTTAEDYKIIQISRECFVSRLHIYSVGNSKWGQIQPITPYIIPSYKSESGKLVHSALHWVGYRSHEWNKPKLLIAFDMAEEKFREVPQPIYDRGTPLDIGVGDLDGLLCLLYRYTDRFEIWAMNEYGDKNSWTKVIHIRGCPLYHVYMPSSLPLCFGMKYAKHIPYERGLHRIFLDKIGCPMEWRRYVGYHCTGNTYTESIAALP